ncbi:MAG: glycosyltransferase family 4 protein [Acidobacteria bacterium]|nr:glycosyltransferase family 4 protein [Acidobacteriota bacterium]
MKAPGQELRAPANETKLRPLVLISSLATGGAERVTVSFMCRLREKQIGARLCTVTARHDGPLGAEVSARGVTRYDLGARRLADPVALLRLVQMVRRAEINIIHAHGQDASILAAAARCLSPVRVVITRHVLEEPSGNSHQRWRARLALAAARRADAIVAVSSAVADWLAGVARLPRNAIHVVPNGIHLERFDRPELITCRDELRRALGFGPEDLLVLVPAVLRDGKGHLTVIKALPALQSRVPTVRVLFAGGGECEGPLRRQAQAHRGAVGFLGPRQDIPELLAASDVVVLPSQAEALPTVLMEAAAAGRPVVATRVGGVSEVVEDGHTGFLVAPDDVPGLVDAVAVLLTDRVRARTFGDRGRSVAYARFDLDLQIERTLALWSEVVIGPQP